MRRSAALPVPDKLSSAVARHFRRRTRNSRAAIGPLETVLEILESMGQILWVNKNVIQINAMHSRRFYCTSMIQAPVVPFSCAQAVACPRLSKVPACQMQMCVSGWA